VTKRRYLWLRDSQHLGRIRLREFSRFQHLIQRIRQAQLGLTLGGIWKAQVGEYVSAAAGDRILCSAFLAIVLLVVSLGRPQAFGDEINIPLRGSNTLTEPVAYLSPGPGAWQEVAQAATTLMRAVFLERGF
jgi:hypothetical protein